MCVCVMLLFGCYLYNCTKWLANSCIKNKKKTKKKKKIYRVSGRATAAEIAAIIIIVLFLNTWHAKITHTLFISLKLQMLQYEKLPFLNEKYKCYNTNIV